MKPINLLAVAAGGALGSVLRYLVSLVPFKGDFPVSTLIVNLVGAVAIGFISGFTAGAAKTSVLFFKTGVCGGFTTFSTLSLEAFGLLKSGRFGLGLIYILLSLLGGLAGIWLGAAAGKLCSRG
jgi:CrcB protein